jgi:hypothetical protein
MLHINKFIDRVKAAESRSQRDLIMTLNEARDLHGDITKLLLILQVLREQSPVTSVEPITSIEVAGGSF